MKYTVIQLRQFAPISRTYLDLFKALGYKGRSVDRLTKRKIKEDALKYSVDLSHLDDVKPKTDFQAKGTKFKISELLVKNSPYKGSSSSLKERLFNNNVLKEECSICKLPSIWQGKPITLQMDHINGVFNDNRLENLRILCPNCHSQTDTYAGRNGKVKASPKPICSCGKEMKKGSKICKTCQDKNQETVKWPPDEELFELVRTLGVKKAAIKCGCWSHNLIHRLSKKNFDYSPYYKPGRQSDLL